MDPAGNDKPSSSSRPPARSDEDHQKHDRRAAQVGGRDRGQQRANDGSKVKEDNQQPERTDASNTSLESAGMEVARRFLADDNVRSATKSQKTRFLRAKGLRDDQIEILLDESENSRSESKSQPKAQDALAVEYRSRSEEEEQQERPRERERERERAPIVTYPEFLARPKQPRPLLTPDTIFNSIYALAGVSALVYGASTLVVEPMSESLHDARHDLFATTSRNLDLLNSKLETVVSVVPPTTRKRSATETTVGGTTVEGSVSEYEDPAELFSRDIGTQTSPASTMRRERSPFNYTDSGMPTGGSRFHTDRLPDEPTSNLHARWVGRLAASTSLLRDDLVGQADGLSDCKAAIDSFSSDLEKMVAQGAKPGSSSGFTPGRTNFFYGASEGYKKPEDPDDEIKKMRDGIRRLKGAMLSTRAFSLSRGVTSTT